MPIKSRLIDMGLCRKGFVKDDRNHHHYIYETINGEKSTVKTMISHSSRGSSDIADKLIAAMARECKLSIANFKKLVKCPLSRGEYEEILRNAGYL